MNKLDRKNIQSLAHEFTDHLIDYLQKEYPDYIETVTVKGHEAFNYIMTNYFPGRIRLSGEIDVSDETTARCSFLRLEGLPGRGFLEERYVQFFETVNEYRSSRYSAFDDMLDRITDNIRLNALKLSPEGHFSDELRTGIVRCWYDDECSYHPPGQDEYPAYVVHCPEGEDSNFKDASMNLDEKIRQANAESLAAGLFKTPEQATAAVDAGLGVLGAILDEYNKWWNGCFKLLKVRQDQLYESQKVSFIKALNTPSRCWGKGAYLIEVIG
jgi:hypothetical protein